MPHYEGDFYGDYYGELPGDYFTPAAESAAGLFIAVIIFALFFAVIIGTVLYIFNAIGLYTMAGRLGIAAPWLAFVPIANSFILGRIAQHPVDGRKKLPYGGILLALNIGTCLGGVLCLSTLIGMIGAALDSSGDPAIVTLFFSTMAGSALTNICSIVYLVFYFIALYQIYKIFSPDNGILFIILSVIFSFLPPFFIFAIRNKNICGMNYGPYGGNVGASMTPGYDPGPFAVRGGDSSGNGNNGTDSPQ